MARRMLRNILPGLQTAGGISHPAKRNVFPCKRALYSNSDHPLSFCAYRYWSNLRQNENYENSHQLILQPAIKPDVEQNVRLFSQSSHCYNQGTKAVSDSGVSNKNKHVKAKKSSVKEFTINDKISEHDMSIKLTKMQNLLKKGKGLSIFIKHKSGSEGSKKSQMQETLQEHLQGVKSLRVEYSNKDTTRITVVPMPAEDGEEKISDAASGAKDKTELS